LGTGFVVFCDFVFQFLTPSTLRGCNFFISNPFFKTFSGLDTPKEGIQVLFGHQKQGNPPLGFGLL